MKRCPECHRFGIDRREDGIEQCLFTACRWVNENNIDVDKIKHPIRFKKFIDAVSKKVEL